MLASNASAFYLLLQPQLMYLMHACLLHMFQLMTTCIKLMKFDLLIRNCAMVIYPRCSKVSRCQTLQELDYILNDLHTYICQVLGIFSGQLDNARLVRVA